MGRRTPLKDILNTYAGSHFPDIIDELNPRFSRGSYSLPYYGKEDSLHNFAIKNIALQGLTEKASTEY